MSKLTLKERIATKIQRSRRGVFTRNDFKKLGNYDQVGRALRELVQAEQLIRLGYGLYAKAEVNELTGKPMLAASGGFMEVCEEALARLRVEWEPNKAMCAYKRGSTQIPARFIPVIKSRFSRKISYRSMKLTVRRREN